MDSITYDRKNDNNPNSNNHHHHHHNLLPLVHSMPSTPPKQGTPSLSTSPICFPIEHTPRNLLGTFSDPSWRLPDKQNAMFWSPIKQSPLSHACHLSHPAYPMPPVTCHPSHATWQLHSRMRPSPWGVGVGVWGSGHSGGRGLFPPPSPAVHPIPHRQWHCAELGGYGPYLGPHFSGSAQGWVLLGFFFRIIPCMGWGVLRLKWRLVNYRRPKTQGVCLCANMSAQ